MENNNGLKPHCWGVWRWGYGPCWKRRVCQDVLGHLWLGANSSWESGSQAHQVNDTQVFGTQSDTFGLCRDVTVCGFSVLVLVEEKSVHTLCQSHVKAQSKHSTKIRPKSRKCFNYPPLLWQNNWCAKPHSLHRLLWCLDACGWGQEGVSVPHRSFKCML